MLTTFLLKFDALGSFHSRSCPPCCVSASFGGISTIQYRDLFFWASQHICFHYLICPFWQHLCPCHTSTPPSPKNILCFFHPLHNSSLCTILIMLCFWLLFYSGFCNGIPEVFEPEEQNFYTASRFILQTLSVSRNPTLTHLPLSGSLNTQRSDRTHFQSGILSPGDPHPSKGVIIFVM